MQITPDQARAELAKRELARRELGRRNTANLPDGVKIGGMYSADDLSQKIIPQFTKGLYESTPLGRQLVSVLPNSGVIEEIQRGTPSPRGVLPFLARLGGEVLGSSPFYQASGGLPKLTNLARLSVGGGAYSGAKALGEGRAEDFLKDSALGAAQTYVGGKLFDVGGKLFDVAGKGLELASKGVKQLPSLIINSLIKPLLKDFSYGKNPGRSVAAENIVANNLDELAIKISSKRKEIGQKISTLLSSKVNSVKKIDLTDALKPLDDAISQARKYPRSNSGLISRLEDARKDLLGIVDNPQTGLSYPTRRLKGLSPAEAAQLKSEIGDLTKWTGNASDDQLVNKAMKQVYGKIKDKINQAVPESKSLNERYADLLSAEVATKSRDKITARQNMVSLSGKLLGGSIFIKGLMDGDFKMMLFGASEPLIEKAVASPALKTRLASVLSKMPAPDLKEFIKKYPILKEIPSVAARLTVPASTD